MSAAEPQTPVVCEVAEEGIAIIAIRRPERFNALNLEVKARVEKHVRAMASDPAIAAIILTGENGVFVAGTDIAEMVDMTSADHQRLDTGAMFGALRDCATPLIAAVEGLALGGGCEMALACDLIIAGEGAKFGQPEIRVGIMPGAGGTQLLLRTVGRYRAMKMLLTGEPVAAADAFAMGLVSEIAPEGQALARALELARLIRRMPPLAVRAIKQAVRKGQDTSLTEGAALERQAFERLFDSADQREGMQAFLEKRRPVYTGK